MASLTAGDVSELVAGQFGDQTRHRHQPVTEEATVLGQIQRRRLWGAFGIKFMDPPAQPVDRGCALGDKDFPAIDQQFQFTRNLIMRGDR